jgi:Ca2+:H+ antiporter
VRRGVISDVREATLERSLSLEISVVLFAAYLMSLLFSLRTHRHLYAGKGQGAHDGAHGSLRNATLLLLIATAGVACMSELLVGAVEEASHALGLTEVFVGVIVVAVIGNAAEHSTAVMMAIRNQMDLALNIAIGSSTQIALFVAPLLVFASYLMPHGPMDLRFTPVRSAGGRDRGGRGAHGGAGRRVELARGRAPDRGLRDPGAGVLLPPLSPQGVC